MHEYILGLAGLDYLLYFARRFMIRSSYYTINQARTRSIAPISLEGLKAVCCVVLSRERENHRYDFNAKSGILGTRSMEF